MYVVMRHAISIITYEHETSSEQRVGVGSDAPEDLHRENTYGVGRFLVYSLRLFISNVQKLLNISLALDKWPTRYNRPSGKGTCC